MDAMLESHWLKSLQPVGRIALILVLTWVALRLSRPLVNRFRGVIVKAEPDTEEAKRVATLTHVIQRTIVVVILGVGVMLVVSELGINLGPLLAAAGIGGLAFGFGAQSLVKDVISGFFLLLEDQVRVGDVVVIGGTGGLVESIGLRTLTLRDLAGNVHIVPHGGVERVTNMTRDYSRYVFEIGVAYREDPDAVMGIIANVGEELRQDPEFGPDIIEPLEVLGVDQFADSAVIIKCRVTTRPIKQWRVAREFNRRLKKAFDAHGIEFPFPHRTIYMGEPKRAAAPPLRVVVDQAGGA
ncbi:MAG: mechanosensitive ion channel family protein [Candidatus Rokubacteria bacterium]|nr:mechanosensitive ion channel family protein [Candidatus Rokubacteria bacterium]